jgi:hypothetical protein
MLDTNYLEKIRMQINQGQNLKYGSTSRRMEHWHIADIAARSTKLIREKMALLVCGDILQVFTGLKEAHVVEIN